MEIKITIEQAEREFFEIIQRVAAGNERIVFTSQGKPKAALVSMEDYQALQSLETPDQTRLRTWMQATQALASEILEKRDNIMVDVGNILDESRNDLEDRDAWIADRP